MNAKTESTALINVQEELRKDLVAQSTRVESTSSFVNLTGKKFTFPDKTEHAGPISGVIIDFINVNSYYDTPYKKGAVTKPACHAVGQISSEMEPSADSINKQADKCSTCPQNQFGSGQNGGKACTNTRVLAIVPPNAQGTADINLIKVSPTGIKWFDKYITNVGSKYQRPCWGVVTEIKFSDADTFPTLRFDYLSNNPDTEAVESLKRKSEALTMLLGC